MEIKAVAKKNIFQSLKNFGYVLYDNRGKRINWEIPLLFIWSLK